MQKVIVIGGGAAGMISAYTASNQGKKVILKAVMSGKKYQVIQDRIFHSIPTTATILFGKHTKIIMYYKSADEWTDKLNHMF